MNRTAEIVIIGAGPGGLACAKELAEHGKSVLVIEKKAVIGPKVCAGGITWNGLLRHAPESLIERSFHDQHIVSARQRIKISSTKPIIATVSRKALGQQMAEDAKNAGAVIKTETVVNRITSDSVIVTAPQGIPKEIRYRYLIGADGSTSIVRKFLKIPVHRMGFGVDCRVEGQVAEMAWHLNTKRFGQGYSWIFPHNQTVSIGAYHPQYGRPSRHLSKQLLIWAKDQGHSLSGQYLQAALVNHDYRGFHFNNTWLIGDAAGLASGLTGEGIYPAIISGVAVAKKIIDPQYPALEIKAMVRKKRWHQQIMDISAKNSFFCTLAAEGLLLGLRTKIINFHTIEMGYREKLP